MWLYVYPVAALAVLLACWLWRKRSRAPLAAMLFFAGTLFPALGFFNVYPFRYSFVADHFQYLASIGVITLVAAALSRLSQIFQRKIFQHEGHEAHEGDEGHEGTFQKIGMLNTSSQPLPQGLRQALFVFFVFFVPFVPFVLKRSSSAL